MKMTVKKTPDFDRTLGRRWPKALRTPQIDPHTLEEVGKQVAVRRERTRQIEANPLRELRQTGRSRNLEGSRERE
jgi:DNA-directed RNA polymerase sigma subunit (sigma70/sigma32)